MSIDSKHAYRFVYLRSEKWSSVRLEALVRCGGKCLICGEASVSNDAHHIFYPSSFWDTTVDDVVILCRPCHELVHAILALRGVKNENLSELLKVADAIKDWCNSKRDWIDYQVYSVRHNNADTPSWMACGSPGSLTPVFVLKRYKDPLPDEKGRTWMLCGECESSFNNHILWPPTELGAFQKIRMWLASRRRL